MKFHQAREYGRLYNIIYKNSLSQMNSYKAHERATQFVYEVKKRMIKEQEQDNGITRQQGA